MGGAFELNSCGRTPENGSGMDSYTYFAASLIVYSSDKLNDVIETAIDQGEWDQMIETSLQLSKGT